MTPSTDHRPPCRQVALGVMRDRAGRVWLSRRRASVHQGGLWGFPGGGLEAGEDSRRALGRELHEELGVTVLAARPLRTLAHHYADRGVLLHAWLVTRWRGRPRLREDTAGAWVAIDELAAWPMPAANHGILQALRLPVVYAVTPEPGAAAGEARYLAMIRSALRAGLRLLYFRAPRAPPPRYLRLARALHELCAAHGAELLLDSRQPHAVAELPAGIQVCAAQLRATPSRPARPRVAASCHDPAELEQAARLEADFALVSPVRATATHAEAEPLGWRGLRTLAAGAAMPVYALGGMRPGDLHRAWCCGAQGIAMLSGLWQGTDPGAVVRACLRTADAAPDPPA